MLRKEVSFSFLFLTKVTDALHSLFHKKENYSLALCGGGGVGEVGRKGGGARAHNPVFFSFLSLPVLIIPSSEIPSGGEGGWSASFEKSLWNRGEDFFDGVGILFDC